MVHADRDDLGRATWTSYDIIDICQMDSNGEGDNSEPGPPPVNGKASKARRSFDAISMKVTGNAGARIACGEIILTTKQGE